MSVVPFERPEPHSAGEAICGNCRYEWVATAPAGIVQLECPECGTRRGAFKYPFGPSEGDESYQCNCGSGNFFIMRKKGHASGAVHCRGCGNEALGWFE